MHFIIDPILDELPPRSRSIAIDYFGFYGNEPLTKIDIARKYNISKDRVRQTIAKFIRKIIRRLIVTKLYHDVYLYL